MLPWLKKKNWPMPDPSFKRALAVTERLDRAVHALGEAQKMIRGAEILASNDYPHNNLHIQNLLGAIKVTSSVLMTELHTWQGYTNTRKEDLPQTL